MSLKSLRKSRRNTLRKSRRQNGGIRWGRKNRTLRKNSTLRKNKRQNRRKQRGG
jgi:hypothetical protein